MSRILILLILFVSCDFKGKNIRHAMSDKVKLLMYSISHNNQIYGSCESKNTSALAFCLEQKDHYKKDNINYYDFIYVDCDSREEVFLCNNFITGLGVDNDGNLVKLIKNHKVILRNQYTVNELKILLSTLSKSTETYKNVSPWLMDNL